ncbi:hypothetical protein CS0771_22660 [Catellatospora sp. IY07-71]|nr:hypothetical protein CS0771_22660 [Catellatospora sp. IY07-71]
MADRTVQGLADRIRTGVGGDSSRPAIAGHCANATACARNCLANSSPHADRRLTNRISNISRGRSSKKAPDTPAA